MKVIIDLCIVPLGVGVSVSKYARQDRQRGGEVIIIGLEDQTNAQGQ